MKRISLCVALLACMPGIAAAYCYSSCYCGVHYSPYALSYYGSGLVPGYVTYSPYALSYEGSGLINECTQYTPYALSYYSSGLVPGYGVCPDVYCDYALPLCGVPFHHGVRGVAHALSPVHHGTPGHAQPAHPPSHPGPGVRPPHPCSPRAESPRHDDCDGMDVIRQHLRGRGFAGVSINRILRVDDELISVDVLIKDRNLLIKYWNPEKVERLSAKEACKQRVYAKYKQDWERFAEQYRQTGGEIYTVSASEPQTIVAALESCPKLGPDRVGPTPVLYAKN